MTDLIFWPFGVLSGWVTSFLVSIGTAIGAAVGAAVAGQVLGELWASVDGWWRSFGGT